MELVTSEAPERQQDELSDSSRTWRYLLAAIMAVPDDHEMDVACARTSTTESSIPTRALHNALNATNEAIRKLAIGEYDFVGDWNYFVPAAKATTVLADNERFDESSYNEL